MQTYQIPHTDLVVSRMAYGCGSLASLGSPKPPVGANHSQETIAAFKTKHSKEAIAKFIRQPLSRRFVADAVRLINTAHDHGITLFDHADIYGFGKSEQVFGEVLKQSPGLRDQVVVQSKCGVRFADNLFEPDPGD